MCKPTNYQPADVLVKNQSSKIATMALPRYRQLKVKTSKMFMDIFKNAAREQLGPFKDAKSFTQHEGTILQHNTLDNTGKKKDITYQEFKTDYAVKYSEVPDAKPIDIVNMLREKGAAFGEEQAKHNYKVISDVTEEIGNVVKKSGKPFTSETFFEVMDKIQVDFDDHGNPVMPTLVTTPENSDAAVAALKEIENDPVKHRRMEDMLARKKEEHNADQARRKLVD